MEKQLSFAEKIGSIRKARNLTMEAFGKIVGVSKGTVSKWESGEIVPPKTTLSLLEKLFGEGEPVSYPIEDKRREGLRVVGGVAPCESNREIKVYALAGAGHPKDFFNIEPIDVILVPKDFILPSTIAIKVRGDSMYPLIREGAYVGIDRIDKEIIGGKIYAVWIPYEGATIKRLYMDTEKVTLKSDNPLFPSFSISLKEISEDKFVLGRVKWVIQKL